MGSEDVLIHDSADTVPPNSEGVQPQSAGDATASPDGVDRVADAVVLHGAEDFRLQDSEDAVLPGTAGSAKAATTLPGDVALVADAVVLRGAEDFRLQGSEAAVLPGTEDSAVAAATTSSGDVDQVADAGMLCDVEDIRLQDSEVAVLLGSADSAEDATTSLSSVDQVTDAVGLHGAEDLQSQDSDDAVLPGSVDSAEGDKGAGLPNSLHGAEGRVAGSSTSSPGGFDSPDVQHYVTVMGTGTRWASSARLPDPPANFVHYASDRSIWRTREPLLPDQPVPPAPDPGPCPPIKQVSSSTRMASSLITGWYEGPALRRDVLNYSGLTGWLVERTGVKHFLRGSALATLMRTLQHLRRGDALTGVRRRVKGSNPPVYAIFALQAR